MTDQEKQEGKTLAMLCYFTFVGLIIAFLMNMEKKNPFIFFHARQMLGLILMLIVSNVFEAYIHSWIGTIMWFITFICWLYGLITAIQGEAKEIPIIGSYFQDWFKNIK